MGTASTIAILTRRGSVHSISCNWGADIEENGKILYLNYRDATKIKLLIKLGNMSSLGVEVNPNPDMPHSFNKPQPDVCVFYGRDRLEEDVKPEKYKSFDDYIENKNFEEYNYIFDEKKDIWFVLKNEKLVPLKNCLLKSEIEQSIKTFIKNESRANELNKILKQKENSKTVKI